MNTCGPCEFSRATINSTLLQCHLGFDYERKKIFQKKTRCYVASESPACEHWEEYFDWMKIKLHARQGIHSEVIGVKWYTETFLFVYFLGKKYELRKSDLHDGGTKRFPRSDTEFRIEEEGH